MRSIFKLGVIALLLGFVASSGFAGTVTPTCVTNHSSSGWVVSPANGGPCGVITNSSTTTDPLLPVPIFLPEGTETAIEPVGDFTINKSFIGANLYVTILDVTGGPSDYILAGNTAPGGLVEVFFYSGVTPDPAVLANYTFRGVACNEADAGGCVGQFTLPFTDGSNVTIFVGSDGNTGTFDPFQVGQNTSDDILFISMPEPSTWTMGAGLLLIAAGLVRRRARG